MNHKVTWFLLIGVFSVLLGRYLYFKPTFIENDIVPDFSAETLTGESFSLNDLKGDYVFIDFWGSWCGPCRRSNPLLRSIYETYKEVHFEEAKSFQLVSIGVEKSKGAWLQAIENDQLDWPFHILDLSENLRFFDAPIASLYKIKEVPSTYLIGPDGKVLARNLDLLMLDSFLKKNAKKESN